MYQIIKKVSIKQLGILLSLLLILFHLQVSIFLIPNINIIFLLVRYKKNQIKELNIYTILN